MLDSFDVDLSFDFAFPPKVRNMMRRVLEMVVLYSSGVFENMDVFIKRYMEVLAASPELYSTTISSTFLEYHFRTITE